MQKKVWPEWRLVNVKQKDDMGWSGGRGAHNLTTDDDD
jgi:hypothetical protein